MRAEELPVDSLTEKITETEIETEEITETEMETNAEVSAEPEVGAESAEMPDGEPAEPEEQAESKEMPVFKANVEWSGEGWIVKGLFKDFTDDTILVQPMCSTDGETYRDCGQAWNLYWLFSEEEGAREKLWNQRCLYDSEEPFKSYLSGNLDRFYIKLRVVREGGIALETQAAVIERKEQLPVSEEIEMSALFAPSMLVREGRPPQICYYGRYQLTVREDVNEEEILALLPDVLPVEVKLQKGSDYIGSDIVDCPVRWKPLNLPGLTAGESVTLADAAEELMVPAGTVLHTQTGIYRVEEPIGMNRHGVSDEVRLVLNVVAEDGQPEGALSEGNDGLEMVFSLKPTGVRAISAYFFQEGDTAWTQIEGLSLTQMVDEQPSTANSGYALVLGREQEPYLSYRRAKDAGEEPTPFLVGVKMEGGVYDGRELVLAWPDSYELPLCLPKVGGSGGNEGNAGSDDRGDSTEDGQRPGLSEEQDEPPSGDSSKSSKEESDKSSTVEREKELPEEADELSAVKTTEPSGEGTEVPSVMVLAKEAEKASKALPSVVLARESEQEPNEPSSAALAKTSKQETDGAAEEPTEPSKEQDEQWAAANHSPNRTLISAAAVLAVLIAGIAIRKRKAV